MGRCHNLVVRTVLTVTFPFFSLPCRLVRFDISVPIVQLRNADVALMTQPEAP